ncbi:ABC transporter, partial [Striga asiatica]
AYVTQEDTLTWTLTVKEAVYFSAQLQLPSTMSESEKRENAERAIREMGLHDSTGTRIGDFGRKGLSNGQRRRLSICIELLKRPRLLFLDEPTSGLDSAASYFIMKRIVQVAREYELTVLSSIHQPVSEVFRLLDGLCLLSSGRMVYFGPTSLANEVVFRNKRFSVSCFANPADHYLRIINADFDEDIECGGAGNRLGTEEVIDLLVRSYSSFGTCKQMKALISEIHKHDGGPTEKNGQTTLFDQCLILTKRSFINMYRDLGYYWLRLAIYIALCTGLGSVFYNIGNSYNSIHERGSLLMFVASLLTIMAIGGFPSFVHDLKHFIGMLTKDCTRMNLKGTVYFGAPSSAVDGETVLRDVWQVEMGYSKWVDLGVLFGMVLVYRFVFFVAIKIRGKSAD